MEVAFFFGYKPDFYNEIMKEVDENIKEFKNAQNKKNKWNWFELNYNQISLDIVKIFAIQIVEINFDLNIILIAFDLLRLYIWVKERARVLQKDWIMYVTIIYRAKILMQKKPKGNHNLDVNAINFI